MQKLLGHHKNPQDFDCHVEYFLEGDQFRVNAEFYGDVRCSEKFSTDGYKNWGLWDFDVIELFLSRHESEYLELQISPLGQKFALKIEKPREVYTEYEPQGFTWKIQQTQTKISFELILKVSDIPGGSSEIRGNIHACRGELDKRCFYGLKLNIEDRPDFHRPENFVSLGVINE